MEAAGSVEAVVRFKQTIVAADALLIATPECNFSIPGVLRNAKGWASRPPKDSPLNGKPVACMGAGGLLGTARVQYHFRQVRVFTNVLPVNRPEVLAMHASEKLDAEGNLTDEMSRQLIRALLVSLAD